MRLSSPTFELTPLDIASGLATGTVAAHGTAAVAGSAPRAAVVPRAPLDSLRAAIAPALTRNPCLVSFSGGIDSSLVLGVAVDLARARGLPDPVPVTWRFRGAARADESSWQERVVAELKLDDWVRLEVGDELDLVGAHSQAVLRGYGLVYPVNSYVHAPLLARARGGALLTGVGGDQVLGRGRWSAAASPVAAARRPGGRELAHLTLALTPPALRRALDPRRGRLASPWLWPAAEREVARRHAAERASEPLWWSGRVRWQPRRRDLALGLATLERLAADHGAHVVNPLADPGFVSAVAHAGGRRGFTDRRAAITAMFGDVAPSAARERRGKARFDEALWRNHARTLAHEWDGEAVDRALVNPRALQSIWRSQEIAHRTGLLLQQVWLARQAG